MLLTADLGTIAIIVPLLILAAIGVYALTVAVSWLRDVMRRGWWR